MCNNPVVATCNTLTCHVAVILLFLVPRAPFKEIVPYSTLMSLHVTDIKALLCLMGSKHPIMHQHALVALHPGATTKVVRASWVAVSVPASSIFSSNKLLVCHQTTNWAKLLAATTKSNPGLSCMMTMLTSAVKE